MRQLVYQVYYTRYQASFYLWWIGSVLKYCKVPKYWILVYFTTQVPDTSDTSAAWVRHEQHEWDTNNTSATPMKNFDFNNDASENIISHSYISYMSNERLQAEEQFHSNASFSCQNAIEKCTTKKLNFVMAKAMSKSYTVDCSSKCRCTFPHSYS